MRNDDIGLLVAADDSLAPGSEKGALNAIASRLRGKVLAAEHVLHVAELRPRHAFREDHPRRGVDAFIQIPADALGLELLVHG